MSILPTITKSKELGIVIVGCGTVGAATVQILLNDASFLQQKTGLKIAIKALVSRSYHRLQALNLKKELFTNDLDAVLADKEVHVVVELIGGIEDARIIFEKALKAGKHVVSANKILLAYHGRELFSLARKNGVSIAFEASCVAGVPIVRALVEGILANRHQAIYGIINGTSNFILSEMMNKGKTYNEALHVAQKEGLAEADSQQDVNGMDSACKLSLLTALAFGQHIPMVLIPVEGIEAIKSFDITIGRELGCVIKLLAWARQEQGEIDLVVAPVLLSLNDPLAKVSGDFNAVSVYSDRVGHTFYYGHGAGGDPTASAVVSDILSIGLGTWPKLFQTLNLWPDQISPAGSSKSSKVKYRYYLRFIAKKDHPIIHDILAVLTAHNIYPTRIMQDKEDLDGQDSLIIITKKVQETTIIKAFARIRGIKNVEHPPMKIRFIDEQKKLLGRNATHDF